jgi:hypothetical protein
MGPYKARGIGVLWPLFYPLFGAPKCNPLKNRERDEVLALGGRCLDIKCNNQLKVGISSGGDFIEEMQLGQNVWGGCHTIVLGGELSNEKNCKK